MSLSDTLRAWARGVKRDAVTLWFACRHAGTPWAPRVLCALVVVYALSPIDLIPDFIPILGYLDDVILLPCLIWIAVRLLPPDVLAECQARAVAWMAREGRKPRSNWGILFVVLVWLLALWAAWTLGVAYFTARGAAV
ncbi:MAG: YkvA family protein [Candidatus Dactylopiibacterium sp.]|nr:YkvA family protein [Candidatus Dactylopiibacterium sp.]